MASLGHVALGMAAARLYDESRPPLSSMAFWSGLSLLPDLDVIGFPLGIQYGDPWGHRGAAHSLILAVAAGVAVGVAARGVPRERRPRMAILASAVLVSHGLLDTMTDGGLGCALLWPFDLTRYFAPWRPIPVAPIGLGMFSAYGMMVVVVELAIFAPALLFALRRTLTTGGLVSSLALWLIALSILGYSPAREAIAGFVLRDGTRFTAGFSEAAFRSVAVGDSESDVRRRLGMPFSESWFYSADPRPPEDRPISSEHACLVVRFESGAVSRLFDADACSERGVRIGLPSRDVETRLGKPYESCWQYSQPGGTGAFRQRAVCFSSGVVRRIVRR